MATLLLDNNMSLLSFDTNDAMSDSIDIDCHTFTTVRNTPKEDDSCSSVFPLKVPFDHDLLVKTDDFISHDDCEISMDEDSFLLHPHFSEDISSSIVSDTSDENNIFNANMDPPNLFDNQNAGDTESENLHEECGLDDESDSNSNNLFNAAIISTRKRKIQQEMTACGSRNVIKLKRSVTLPNFHRVRGESLSKEGGNLKKSASLPSFHRVRDESSPKKDDHLNVASKIMKTMKCLEDCMEKSLKSQAMLQEWDQKNGLPLSHSPTMMNTSRSRIQLMDGVILKKWNGSALIKNIGGLKVVYKKRKRKKKLAAKKRIVTNRKIINKTRRKNGDESSVVPSFLTSSNRCEKSPNIMIPRRSSI